MNAINRIGQRVVCVAFRWYSVCENVKAVPILNKEYTVEGFGDCPALFGEPSPGIYLREIETPKCNCYGLLSWDITGFRPVVEDESKTDISEFKKLLDEHRAPEHV